MNTDKPSHIERGVNRRKFPLGHARPLEYVNHLLNCAGVRLTKGTYDHDKV